MQPHRLSTPKLIFVLLLLCFYVFGFTILSITSQGEQAQEESSESVSATTTTQTTISLSSQWKPQPQDYPVSAAPLHYEVGLDDENAIPITTTTTETTTSVESDTTQSTTSTSTSSTSATAKSTTSKSTTTESTTTKSTTTTVEEPQEVSAWGNLTVSKSGSAYTDDAFDIVCQIVAYEIGSSFHAEAIKAQAVAAYSYVKYYNNRGSAPAVGLKSNPSQTIQNAVADVVGQAIYYNGSIAQTVYSASSGGASASAKDVWGGSIAYLVSVESEYDASYDPNYGRTTTFTADEVKSMVKSTTGITLSGSPADWIELLPEEDGGVLDGGYIGKLLIGGEDSYTSGGKKITITGRVLREQIFSFKLRSAKFKVNYSAASDSFTFTTYGYGHGVGLSQNGANLYAKHAGWSYKQILTHYYQGVEVH